MTPNLGVLLRHWRDLRRRSQLDLSLDTGISQKQISFVESGRSVPGRQTLMAIAQALDVPLRDRNTLLLAAGYAPMFSENAWDSAEMVGVTNALKRMLRQHEPFPALVMDRYWNVLMTNEAAPRFFGCFIDMAARRGPRNMLHLMFDPQGMRPFIANWPDVARSLFERVYRESIGRVVDDKTKALLAELLAYPDVESEWKNPVAIGFMPTIPLGFVMPTKEGPTKEGPTKEGPTKEGGDRVLNYFSMVTTVGTPQTVAAQELRLECMFPADEATENHHAELMKAAGSP
ncbi:helix-turn-helix domain-containing protein [Mesorhizobium loti R88b]|uniref:Helix-turn-helix domain-containing protein n=2 Tax=Rhizobium loti TaxID=381 RepID=A0A6M7WPR4_RHILI|nr:helix-turn-helix transcriptional regulator [Mesorhizobium loti]QKD06080.1 helix-turn-helix domain-containing protein [Mesorhizobium loti R88b]